MVRGWTRVRGKCIVRGKVSDRTALGTQIEGIGWLYR